MSRITAIGFFAFDAAVSLATIVQSSLAFTVVLLTLLGSIATATLSASIRSVLWPRHFWDETQQAPELIDRG